ncbi:hypothetical protein PG993_014074 [Apiospora rasikravindrae]|uniref:Uncharacterized protein n=1 Tax=Apiospora rasikravindrae TaxID=990691 RepID=A0ABR1RU21_9PEZI
MSSVVILPLGRGNAESKLQTQPRHIAASRCASRPGRRLRGVRRPAVEVAQARDAGVEAAVGVALENRVIRVCELPLREPNRLHREQVDAIAKQSLHVSLNSARR